MGNLYAAHIPLDGSTGAPLLGEESEWEEIEVRPGHVDEPGDVRLFLIKDQLYVERAAGSLDLLQLGERLAVF